MPKFLTAEQMLSEAEKYDYAFLYKYVRVDGEFRFLRVGFDVSHKDMVDQYERAVVESAGIIGIRKDEFEYSEIGSWSLNVKWEEVDTILLTTLLERPLKCL